MKRECAIDQTLYENYLPFPHSSACQSGKRRAAR